MKKSQTKQHIEAFKRKQRNAILYNSYILASKITLTQQEAFGSQIT